MLLALTGDWVANLMCIIRHVAGDCPPRSLLMQLADCPPGHPSQGRTLSPPVVFWCTLSGQDTRGSGVAGTTSCC